MRRLTNKDKKKHDEDAAPDFYKISQEHPLPEITTPQQYLGRLSAVAGSTGPLVSRPMGFIPGVEAALLERHRIDAINEMQLLAASSRLQPGLSAYPIDLSMRAAAAGWPNNGLYDPTGRQAAGVGGGYGGFGAPPPPAPMHTPSSLQQLMHPNMPLPPLGLEMNRMPQASSSQQMAAFGDRRAVFPK
jgi:hypothetical protein